MSAAPVPATSLIAATSLTSSSDDTTALAIATLEAALKTAKRNVANSPGTQKLLKALDDDSKSNETDRSAIVELRNDIIKGLFYGVRQQLHRRLTAVGLTERAGELELGHYDDAD